MNVVLIASEAVPFAKTGGLADVAGALPRALSNLGVKATLMLPCYRQARDANIPLHDSGIKLQIPVGSNMLEAHVQKAKLPGTDVDVYLIDRPAFFDRSGLYQKDGGDYSDNSERFIFFQRAALEAIRVLDLRPDVIHCNDWQTGLIPIYLDEFYRNDPHLKKTGSLFTIHNMAYQGSFWHWDMPLTGLDWRLFNWRQLEHHGRINFLKAGLVSADLLSTVSPTYAREIQTHDYGCGFDGLLRARRYDLHGIVNGIDPTVWNPLVDPFIAAKFGSDDVSTHKPVCKAMIQERAGLPVRPEVPLFAQIGRLDPQKGWDLLMDIAENFLQGDVQLIVLGEGQPRYHGLLENLAHRHPGKIRVFLEFSNVLSHQIEAGADLFLMPSLYEPCGLNQLYSLAYGTIPIVRSTGGLADTVVDTNPETIANRTATGFAFRDANAHALKEAIDRALALWPDGSTWSSLIANAMKADWTWERVARAYLGLYNEVSQRRNGRSVV
jgi:starch synthase